METDLGEPYQNLQVLALLVNVDSYYLIVGSVLAVLLFLSGLISGSEVAFFSLDKKEIMNFEHSESNTEKLIYKFFLDPKHLLATILVFNNLVNVGIVTLSTHLSWQIGDVFPESRGKVITIVYAVATVLIIFCGEVIPKIYAKQRAKSFSKMAIRLMNPAHYLLLPFSLPLLKLSKIVEKRIQTKGYKVSSDDLSKAIEMTTNDDEQTSSEETDILKGIVHFGTVTVTQIMRSRMDITAVSNKMDFHQLMDKINKCGFSRIPVYEDTIDRVTGILYIKDLLPYLEKSENFNWQKVLREAYFIPESKKIDDLLKNFQEKRVHMAIVVDEYGGTSGLVTLEDIIEEIVGEINDEFDVDEVDYKQINEDTFVFEGKTSLNDLAKILDVKQDTFDNVKGENESLGGMLLEIHKKLPHTGEEVQIKNFRFTIEAVNSKRIKRVKIERLEIEEDEIEE